MTLKKVFLTALGVVFAAFAKRIREVSNPAPTVVDPETLYYLLESEYVTFSHFIRRNIAHLDLAGLVTDLNSLPFSPEFVYIPPKVLAHWDTKSLSPRGPDDSPEIVGYCFPRASLKVAVVSCDTARPRPVVAIRGGVAMEPLHLATYLVGHQEYDDGQENL
jgi:hypothetical protein